MAKKPLRVVLDTYIIISALVYGGKPEQIYNLTLQKQITPIISAILLAELTETLVKKFNFDSTRIKQLERIISKHFRIVHPKKIFNIIRDEDDNRVLEAAFEGECTYIITGDKDLLEYGSFKNIQIVTAEQFLFEFEKQALTRSSVKS